MIERYSSRRGPLGTDFLSRRLAGAVSYDRIAGYFRSSIFEVAGEAFDQVTGAVRILCNSELDVGDIETARGAAMAMRTEWCETRPEDMASAQRPRYERLSRLLRSGKIEVRVLPNASFGLIHGKAGVIRYADGTATSFLGSANETAEAFTRHYELVWEDRDPDTVAWVQAEFDALWTHRDARPLAEAIVEDVERILTRTVIQLPAWKGFSEPQAPLIEAPIARQGDGLAPHQKAFVTTVVNEVETYGKARFLLADSVGLGKTVQLGMAAELIALSSSLPVLILAPKNLLPQWQAELRDMLGVPSARWERGWTTEDGVRWPGGVEDCPRRIGIFPTSLITAQSKIAEPLGKLRFSCIVLDEAHRARQSRVLGRDPKPNKLLEFMLDIGRRTDSLLMGTATPVQTHRDELFDLMRILWRGCERVLGSIGSRWTLKDEALDLVAGRSEPPESLTQVWAWLRQPLPPKEEHRLIGRVRAELDLADNQWFASSEDDRRLGNGLRNSLEFEGAELLRSCNPFLRHVIKRTRDDLKHPDGTPYFKKISIRLHGENDADALDMPPAMAAAYEDARVFCQLLAQMHRGAGLLKTLLLRRIGSSLFAGRKTAEKLLEREISDDLADEEDDDLPQYVTGMVFSKAEGDVLRRAVGQLRDVGNDDPKLARVLRYLRQEGWRERGCIIFSQYFDTVAWMAEQLTVAFPDEPIGVYAGSGKSYLLIAGQQTPMARTEIQARVQSRRLRVLVATDAASEGLNLQRLQTLINLDLPWNPARLEQRKGRIERIGQIADTIDILNLRYRGSVEDDVHHALSGRLEQIRSIFGTIPDTLEDVWVKVAQGEIDEARQIIDAVPREHPFQVRYRTPKAPEDWDRSTRVLYRLDIAQALKKPW